MGWASLIVSVGGVGVAAFAAIWAVTNGRRQTRALAEETHERKEADAREEERRKEELELLRQQVQRSEEHDRQQDSAQLVGESDGRRERSSSGIDYTIRVRNVGAATARDVEVWIAEQLPGDIVGGAVTNPHRLGALASDDPWRDVTLTQPPITGGGVPRSGRIRAYWVDRRGDQRDVDIGRIDILR